MKSSISCKDVERRATREHAIYRSSDAFCTHYSFVSFVLLVVELYFVFLASFVLKLSTYCFGEDA